MCKGSATEVKKESQCVQKASVTIESTKDEIRKSPLEITLECKNDRLKMNRTFQQEPRPILVKECDEKSKALRGQL